MPHASVTITSSAEPVRCSMPCHGIVSTRRSEVSLACGVGAAVSSISWGPGVLSGQGGKGDCNGRGLGKSWDGARK